MEMGDKYFEHRMNVTFCSNLGKATKSSEMLKQLYGGEVICIAHVFERRKWLYEGREKVEFITVQGYYDRWF
jgi:hypothetical protein